MIDMLDNRETYLFRGFGPPPTYFWPGLPVYFSYIYIITYDTIRTFDVIYTYIEKSDHNFYSAIWRTYDIKITRYNDLVKN